MSIIELVNEFIQKIIQKEVEIYNEASIQYELAIFLRNKLPKHKIQLERNVSYFGLTKNKFIKKEIDIVIFNQDKTEKSAIEIKFPTNGQYPEQMFSFCKDIKFLEELKNNGFSNNVFLCFANDSNFWSGSVGKNPIYTYFRKSKIITGIIQKPTGSKDEQFNIIGSYVAKWQNINNLIQYFTIQI
ncbi:hypothetical protein [Candidatus Nitrosarchaeum limnium]|jgi:hypothetical protein|uniref:Uncharacterized protein n=1 Tax=Candidatus Nitrosarchaeum limnium BG20 TaxID=859192 RepID=S2ENS3_9ARCH|nr:hypothetical protein [Candidatus Nitrosarchaeum limnium]EPA06102.1 hypothetical protein BG20_I1781 [Candidatus Nitrosarchaeum limnium BG20]